MQRGIAITSEVSHEGEEESLDDALLSHDFRGHSPSLSRRLESASIENDPVFRGETAALSPHVKAFLFGQTDGGTPRPGLAGNVTPKPKKLGPPVRTPIVDSSTGLPSPRHNTKQGRSARSRKPRALGTPVSAPSGRRSKSLSRTKTGRRSRPQSAKSKKKTQEANTRPRASPRPAWDSTIHNLDQYKLSKEELLKQKVIHTSRFDHLAHLRLQNEAGVTLEEQERELNAVLSPPWEIRQRSNSAFSGGSDENQDQDQDQGRGHRDQDHGRGRDDERESGAADNNKENDACRQQGGQGRGEARGSLTKEGRSARDSNLIQRDESMASEVDASPSDGASAGGDCSSGLYPLEDTLQSTFMELAQQVQVFESSTSRSVKVSDGLDLSGTSFGPDRELVLMTLSMRLLSQLASCESDLTVKQEANVRLQTDKEHLSERVNSAQNIAAELESRCKELERENLHLKAICGPGDVDVSTESMNHTEKRISRRQQLMAKWRGSSYPHAT
mmetsp:Transcript_24067/g.42493  ORF Transcript_24067/g.42493 Transcript_24067/m.42493 type:complete len:502 (-) Transcript_24067:175-1680(-)